MKSSEITIVVPVYNGAFYIRDALKSILNQTHPATEIIVIDDGSTDNTREIVRDFGTSVVYFFQNNAGAPSARNRGIQAASGEWIGFLDADDTYGEQKLEIQISRFRDQPSLEVVMGSREHFMNRAGEGEPPKHERLELEDHVPLQLGCGLFRRTAFERVGFFDESLKYCDDYDWFNRAREMSIKLLLHDDVVLHQRVHSTNMTRHRDIANRYQLMAFKKSIDRRRLNPKIPRSLPPLSNYHENSLMSGDDRTHE